MISIIAKMHIAIIDFLNLKSRQDCSVSSAIILG